MEDIEIKVGTNSYWMNFDEWKVELNFHNSIRSERNKVRKKKQILAKKRFKSEK